MKRFLALLLCLLLILSVTACSSGKDETPEEPEKVEDVNPAENETPEEPETPAETETPEEPENAEKPESEEPAKPAEVQKPAEPEKPAETQKPTEPETPAEPEKPAAGNALTGSLSDIVAASVKGVDIGELVLLEQPIEGEGFEYNAYTKYADGMEAIAYIPMIGSIPWHMVFVRVPAGMNASSVAADMQNNCDPNRWICVSADVVKSCSNGDVALLVMVGEEHAAIANAIISNFLALK